MSKRNIAVGISFSLLLIFCIIEVFISRSPCGSSGKSCSKHFSDEEISQLEQLAEKGDLKSNGVLISYYDGKQNKAMTYRWLLNAAKLNNYDSVISLYLGMEDKEFVNVLPSDRNFILSKLAYFSSTGNADAQFWLGQGCLNGLQFSPCNGSGFYWLTRSAISGNRHAMEILSSRLATGDQKTAEKEIARAWAEEMARGDAPPYFKQKSSEILIKIKQ